MVSLWLKNRNSFGETYGVTLQIIRKMQSDYKNCEVKLMLKKQEKMDITTGSLKKILGRMPNWKSPGPDLVQGFWLKNFSSLHERVRLQLKECLDSGFVPSWLPRGRTSLLLEDKSKGNVASNYRTITCLPLMWKLLTGEIADQIYAHLALWWAPNYSTVQFLLKRSTRFLLTNVYKKMCGIFFFFCLDLELCAKN